MLPGLGNIDPRKMAQMMRQLGIKQDEIEVKRVIIEKSDNTNIIIEPANVQKIVMSGQESWQVTGKAREEAQNSSAEDITLIIEKTGATKEKAKLALEKANGDIASAILELSS